MRRIVAAAEGEVEAAEVAEAMAVDSNAKADMLEIGIPEVGGGSAGAHGATGACAAKAAKARSSVEEAAKALTEAEAKASAEASVEEPVTMEAMINRMKTPVAMMETMLERTLRILRERTPEEKTPKLRAMRSIEDI